MAVEEAQSSSVSYEDLAALEDEFNDVDTEIMRKQYTMSEPLYAKRQALVSQIPNFWALVFETAPPEIDSFIQPSDSEIFAKCLIGLDVRRFEVPLGPEKLNGNEGDPRSISIRFEFAENEWFKDTILEKRFWYRRALDGWTGLVSEPVRVHWKKGKDMTQGLMDGALALWGARKKAGDMTLRDLPEFDALSKLVENWNGGNTTFFTWFAFVSSRRWVSAEESQKANTEENERRRKVRNGEEVESVDSPEPDTLEQQVEVHEDGDSLAMVIADDLWPGAIKYFTQAQEGAGISDDDFEEADEETDDDETDNGPIDIRSLVQDDHNKSSSDEPRKKRQKR